MHPKTIRKIAFLQGYIQQRRKRWYKKYGNNLRSVRVERKYKNDRYLNYYVIVFNFAKKIPESELAATEYIPPYFDIRFPDGQVKRIKTDVRQSGEFQLHAAIMDSIKEVGTNDPGTIGLFLRNSRNDLFALTNYHVAANSLKRSGQFVFDRATNPAIHRVAVGNLIGTLYKGKFTQQIDAAIVLLQEGAIVHNVLPDGRAFIRNDFHQKKNLGAIKNKPAELYVRSKGGRFTTPIIDVLKPFRDAVPFEFLDMIMITRCTVLGDSGSLLLQDGMIVGIVLGGDDLYTYIVPYYKIFDEFKLTIL
ncbi:hypothetical protein [Chitinophaga barathri]|uniref:Serine protease n=1 Tax=Chitinophaga barathri TaxID=1647451 RepID=A0A3N4MLZ9_9BACT|nr:hypothetical protein [Chitinophaga barathri]RPD43096.1 hypothetical protein EG028_02035 [Chitinophaga barathri]